jgi:DNA polymerase-3 subunit delta'
VPGFQSIIDQEKPLRQLFRILQTGNIPHAQLFTGIEGVGKTEAAFTFAMACNCRKAEFGADPIPAKKGDTNPNFSSGIPCGDCASCRKITSRNHPDVISVQPQNNRIRIAQIRELHGILAMKPYEARSRFVIISDAHTMNAEAANSLLKVLEEPPPQTFLILTAHHLHDLLPTITSRCQHVRFRPISREALVNFIKNQADLNDLDAGLLADLAKGSLSKARQLAASGWLKRRAWILNIITADLVRAPTVNPLTVLLAFSEKLAQSKEKLVEALEIMQTWFRDLMVFPSSPDKIMNQDRIRDLKRITQQMNMHDTLSHYDAIQTALDRIDGNANPRLVLDVMLINILGFKHEKDRRHPV